jgi:hypothetical protein
MAVRFIKTYPHPELMIDFHSDFDSSPKMSEKTSVADPATSADEATPRASTTSTHDSDIDGGFQDIGQPLDEDGEPLTWTFSRFLQDMRDSSENQKCKHLALTWKDLSVEGIASSAAFGPTCWSDINPLESIKASRQSNVPNRVWTDTCDYWRVTDTF